MIRGAHPDIVIVDEALIDTHTDDDGATVMTWPATPGAAGYVLNPRPLLHDPALDTYRAGLDELGRFSVELPADPTPEDERVVRAARLAGLRTDLPDPAAVLAAGAAAAAGEVARMVEEWSAAVAEASRRMAPVFAAIAEALRASAAHCEAVGLLPPPPADSREELLAAKRTPGRTGPPPARMDGRRSR